MVLPIGPTARKEEGTFMAMRPEISVKNLMMQAFLTGWELSDKSISQDEYLQSAIQVIEVLQVEPENLYAEEGLGLPALYILDIMLPGMDGLEILRRLREGRDTADVPVIMLTVVYTIHFPVCRSCLFLFTIFVQSI